MEELNKKLGELNQRLGAINNQIKNTDECFRSDLLSERQELIKKISILNDAEDILLGIGI